MALEIAVERFPSDGDGFMNTEMEKIKREILRVVDELQHGKGDRRREHGVTPVIFTHGVPEGVIHAELADRSEISLTKMISAALSELSLHEFLDRFSFPIDMSMVDCSALYRRPDGRLVDADVDERRESFGVLLDGKCVHEHNIYDALHPTDEVTLYEITQKGITSLEEPLLDHPSVEDWQPPRAEPDDGRQKEAHAVERFVFRRKGEAWVIAFGCGEENPYGNLVGLTYIATLLSKPKENIPVIDVEDSQERSTKKRRVGADTNLDQESKKAIYKEIQEYDDEIERAKRDCDSPRTKIAEAEKSRYVNELAQGNRLLNPESRNICGRVRKAVTSALERIRKQDEPCYRHLDRCLTIQTICRYDPDKPIDWQF